MPTIYRCSSCALGFETGWYHYHRVVDGAMAATFVVCSKCGSQYMLDHKYDDGRDELHAWGGRITMEPTEREGVFPSASATPPMAKLPSDLDFRPVRKKQPHARLEGVRDDLRFEGFECAFCHKVGTLIGEWPEGNKTCPRCGKHTLDPVDCYMT